MITATIVVVLLNSIMQRLSQLVFECVTEIYKNVTALDFKVVETMKNLGLGNNMSIVSQIMQSLGWVVFAICVYITILNAIVGAADGTFKGSFGSIFKKIIVGALLLTFAPTFVNLIYQTAQSIWVDFLPIFTVSAEDMSTIGADIGVINALFGLILSLALGYNVLGAAINQIERFITLYVWYYVSPVAMGFYMSSENDEIPKKYFVSLLLQIFAIYTNQLFFWMFGMQIDNISQATNKNVIMSYFIAFAMLSLAKNSEKIINALGFHTLPTPNGSKDLFASIMTTTGLVKGAVKATKGLARAAYAPAKTASDYINNKTSSKPNENSTLTTVPKPQSKGPVNPMDSKIGTSKDGGSLPMSKEEIAKKAQSENFKTTYDRDNKKLVGTGQFGKAGDINAKANTPEAIQQEQDAVKQVAADLGNTNLTRKGNSVKNAIENSKGLKDTENGIKQATAEYSDSLAKTNAFLASDNSYASQNTLSNTDAARALGLHNTMPSFIPDPTGAVRKESNGDFTIHGTKIDQQKDGSYIHRPVSMTFSTEGGRGGSISGGLKYSDSGVSATADGNIKAYETQTANIPSEQLKQAIADGRAKPLAGKNGLSGVKSESYPAEVMNEAYNPKHNLNGGEIASAGYKTDDGNVFFVARIPNRDGSYESKMMMHSNTPVNNGDYVNGYVATGRQYPIPNASGGSDWLVEMKEPTAKDYKNMAAGSTSASIVNDTSKIRNYETEPYKDMHDEIVEFTSKPYIPIANTDDQENIRKILDEQQDNPVFAEQERRAQLHNGYDEDNVNTVYTGHDSGTNHEYTETDGGTNHEMTKHDDNTDTSSHYHNHDNEPIPKSYAKPKDEDDDERDEKATSEDDSDIRSNRNTMLEPNDLSGESLFKDIEEL